MLAGVADPFLGSLVDPAPRISKGLWSGRLPGVADPHSDLLLARGFLPYWPPRGTCEVRGRVANLWYAAAKALGFEALSIRCPDSLFVGHVQGMGMEIKGLVSLPRRLRRPKRLPDVVFSDVGSLPLEADAVKYWDAWTTSHLFCCRFTAALSLQRCLRSRPRPLPAGRRGL